MTTFRNRFLDRFQWIDGHADILGMFADGDLLAHVGDALVEPFRDRGFTKVAGVEARGFVLGTAAALAAGVGFVPIRKSGAIHPGPKARKHSEPDWRGDRHELSVQRAVIGAGDRVLVADDWAETGSQAIAARALIEATGAAFAGLSLLVDQLAEETRARLEPVAAVVRYEELPLNE